MQLISKYDISSYAALHLLFHQQPDGHPSRPEGLTADLVIALVMGDEAGMRAARYDEILRRRCQRKRDK